MTMFSRLSAFVTDPANRKIVVVFVLMAAVAAYARLIGL
jgi:hypothetical protein